MLYQNDEGLVIIYGQGWHRREIGWVDKISHKTKAGWEKNYDMTRVGRKMFFISGLVFNNFLTVEFPHQRYQYACPHYHCHRQ